MSNLVIVALPAEDDYIHQISSQKVPHFTLLFLGENSNEVKNLTKILDFVEHAAERSLCRFGMEVERRGELGEAKADVLFFSKRKWSGYEAVKEYRSFLLKNDNIRAAYDRAGDQHPEFIPHLTLGYPDNPAKKDKRDYPGTSYVNFDRIAVWVEEFDGPEFPLRTYEWDMDVAMSNVAIHPIVDEIVDNILMHYGKKGMKWGVQKRVTGSKAFKSLSKASNKNVQRHHARSSARTAKRKASDRSKEAKSTYGNMLRTGTSKKDFSDARKDHKWFAKTHASTRLPLPVAGVPRRGNAQNNISKDAMKHAKPGIKALKKQPEFSSFKAKRAIRKAKYDLNPSNPIAAKYNKAVQALYMKGVVASAPKHLTKSPSGKWENTLTVKKHYWRVEAKRVEATHAAMSDSDLVILVRPIFDDEGYINDFELLQPDESMEQSAMLVEEFLQHYGKLGMKWGKRSTKRSEGPQKVTIRDKGKKIKTKGGGGHPSTESALSARTIGQKGKKSGLKSLTDHELQTYAKRIQMEQNVSRLMFSEKSRGAQFVDKLMGRKGSQLADKATTSVGKQAVNAATRKSMKVARIAAFA